DFYLSILFLKNFIFYIHKFFQLDSSLIECFSIISALFLLVNTFFNFFYIIFK
ncbi:hypothetical protein HMPREF3188_00104, partial [Tissierellia bacterium KA00581]